MRWILGLYMHTSLSVYNSIYALLELSLGTKKCRVSIFLNLSYILHQNTSLLFVSIFFRCFIIDKKLHYSFQFWFQLPTWYWVKMPPNKSKRPFREEGEGIPRNTNALNDLHMENSFEMKLIYYMNNLFCYWTVSAKWN